MDYEHEFEELPIRIAGKQVAFVNGTALLELDEGYDFVVTGIVVEADDDEVVRLHERSDDPEIVKAFRDLSAELYDNAYAQERFAEALAEYQWEAA